MPFAEVHRASQHPFTRPPAPGAYSGRVTVHNGPSVPAEGIEGTEDTGSATDGGPDAAGEPRTGVTAGHATGIMAASITAAASSLLITVISARTLTVAQNKEFLVFWGFMFGVFGVISGIQTESTRAALAGARIRGTAESAGSAEPPGRAPRRAGILTTALLLGLVIALLTLLAAPAWAPRLTPSTRPLIAALIAAGVWGYAGQASLSGILAGTRRWNLYSALMAAEALLRLLLALAVAIIASSLIGLEAAAAAPALVWLLLLLVPAVRAPAGSRADVGTARLTSFNLQAMLSSASWAVLVTGFPTLLEITSPGADAAEVAIVILAVSVTRSPIMIPLQAFQGVLITTIADAEPSRRLTSVLRILGILLAGGALLAIVVAAVGPWLVRAVYGAQYDPSPPLLGFLTLAAASMASLVLTGASTIALNNHRAYTLGWVLAAVAAALLLWILPLGVSPRATLALGLAPLTGICVHLRAIVRADEGRRVR